MQKNLFALALLCAAGGAFAQSNVTLFGVVDASVARISGNGGHTQGLANGSNTSSRLGFRGTEDLGGGLSAGFWLEGSLGLDTGTSNGYQFDRRSTVSLSSGFGEVRLGRDKVPAYLTIETFDPFADIGVGGVGASNMLANAATAAGGGTTGATGTTIEGSAPKRLSNTVGYILPATLGGFYGQLQYGFGETVSTAVNDKRGNSMGFRAGYMAGPVNVSGGYSQVQGGPAATEIKYKSSSIGGSYNFGIVKPMVLFATERGNGRRIDLLEIGATAPLGAGELRAAVSRFDLKDSANDSRKFALGYGYNLSKRTQLYATVARVSNDGAATRGISINGLASPGVAAGGKSTGYEVGVRHSF
ncbi:porin [Sphingomonas sp. NCPPB 2930]